MQIQSTPIRPTGLRMAISDWSRPPYGQSLVKVSAGVPSFRDYVEQTPEKRPSVVRDQ